MRPALSLFLPVLFCFSSLFSHGAGGTVTITQAKSGNSLEIEVESIENGNLTFKTLQGRQFTIPVSQLTPDSVQRLKDHLAKASAPSAEFLETAKLLNKIIGHDLFGEKESIWTEDSGDVAKRLNWKLESRKKDSSSYRYYTKLDYHFLGAHPYCATLYGGEGGRPERISLVYANKGDFGSRLGMGPEHFKVIHPDREPPEDLEEAIEIDAEVIAEKLTEGLGEAEQQYYGEKEDKRKVKRWNFGDHAFLLSSLEGEYTSLLVVPKEDADAQGKVRFVADSILKKIQITNVTKGENGDVWIDNIPMVDQGPKGYCAPATFERAMRYMRIPADMYLLATAATEAGGGTNTTKLSEDCKRIVSSKARRIKELDLREDFEIKNLKKFIDKGVPVLWQMRSLEGYNELANARSEARSSVTDFGKWTAEIEAEAQRKFLQFKENNSNHHICMVIGYNETTREVAVSDSWGPNYELRWVHEDIARAVTSYGGFVIDF
ncbi:MAG: C39 family peptidase [Verrucomicrobiales bacterium]|nr:C39 family peptidase [Verrucomicrobiales bacterium]